MRPITRREHLLLIVALFIGAAMFYVPLRHRPAQADLAELRGKVAERREAARSRELPERRHTHPQRLVERIDRRARAVGARVDRLERLRAGHTPLGSPAAIAELRLALSAHAERSGLRVQSLGAVREPAPDRQAASSNSAPVAVSASASAGVIERVDALPQARDLDDWLSGRPQYELVASCRFEALRRFAEGLNGLPWKLIVTDFDIQSTDRGTLEVTLLFCI